MKIWIIGSHGMLGTSLLQRCQSANLSAIGTSKHEANVCDVELLQKKCLEIKPTHIVNCAAYMNLDGAENDPKTAFNVNADGAYNVAKIARDFGSRLLHISTDYVFSGTGNQPYVEESLCAPINIYGMSKWEGEKKILEILPNACILRTSWVFGSKGKNFISSLLDWFQQKEELQVVSDQFCKPTYCHDLAEAVLKLLDIEGIVHFANECGNSRYQIAIDLMHCVNELGIPMKCRSIIPGFSAQFETIAKRPVYSILDTTKYHRLTSIKPRPWVEAAREFLNIAIF